MASLVGDVNAPGVSAALLATLVGSLVANLAFFGNNIIFTRNSEVSVRLWVFVDKTITHIAYLHKIRK